MKINSANRYRTPWQRTGQKTQMRRCEFRLVTYRTLAQFFLRSHATPASPSLDDCGTGSDSPALPRHRRVKI